MSFGFFEVVFAVLRALVVRSIIDESTSDLIDSERALSSLRTLFFALNIYVGIAIFVILIIYLFQTLGRFSRLGVNSRIPKWLSIAGWFIPLANMVIPYLLFRRLANANPATKTKAITALNFWWFLWILGVFTGGMSEGLYTDYLDWENIDVLFSFFTAIGVLVAMAGSLFACIFFKTLKKVEKEIYESKSLSA